MATTKKSKVRKPTKIFTMTVVSGDPNTSEIKNRLRCRCWGYYFNRRDAARAIENNWTDMSELDYYHYAVLSELKEGPMPSQKELQWYEFNWWHEEDYHLSEPPRDKNGVFWPHLQAVTKIEKPEKYQNMLFGGLS
jgi:hypothetical protein